MRKNTGSLQEGQLVEIVEAAGHLAEIIDDILDLSKIEEDKLTLDEGHVDLYSIVSHVCAMVATRAHTKGLKLITEIDTLPFQVVGDATRIKQALLNYAINAVKFTEAGTITLREILVRDEADMATIRFEVEDTGAGISDDAVDKLFTEFGQIDNPITRKSGGTGLGLAITKRLARLMGGDVGLTSRVGKGSTFWFTATLKKINSAVETKLVEKTDGGEEKIAEKLQGKHILVVDDDPVNRMILQRLLSKFGAVVDSARDGLEAFDLSRKQNYDLVLMDMQMPNLDGLQATRRIRSMPGRMKVPIIAITANAFVEDRHLCIEAGMNAFIAKPVRHEILFRTIMPWIS